MNQTIDSLFQNITNQRTQNSNQVVLDNTVLTASQVALLNTYTGKDNLTLTKTNSPTNVDNTVSFTGTVDSILGMTKQTVVIAFKEITISNAPVINFSLTLNPTKAWRVSDAFTYLGRTLYGILSFTQVKLVLTTAPLNDKNTEGGLTFEGVYTTANQYLSLDNFLPISTAINLAGTITSQNGRANIAIAASNSLAFTLKLTDVNDIPLTGVNMTLDNSYDLERSQSFGRIQLKGTATLEQSPMECVLIKTDADAAWSIVLNKVPLTATTPSNATLINQLQISSTLAYFPAAIVAATDITIAHYGFSYNPYSGQTGVELELDYTKLWDQIPLLNNIQNVKSLIYISRYAFGTSVGTTFKAFVSGDLTIGSTTVHITCIVGPLTDWVARISTTDIALPSLTDLDNLMGNVKVDTSVPSGMKSQTMLQVNKIEVGMNVKDFILNYTEIDFIVKDTWYIVPNKLGISDVQLKLRITDPQNTKLVTGSFGGNIVIDQTAAGKPNIPIPVLAKKAVANGGWTIDIAKNKTVPIPGIPSLLALIGADAAINYLPSIFSTLDGFVLSDVYFQFSATHVLEQFRFYVGQKDAQVKWQIITDKVFVTNIKVNLMMDNPLDNTGGRKVFGLLEGNININNTVVPIQALKPTAVSGWQISIVGDSRVFLPTLSDIFSTFDSTATYQNLPTAIQSFPRIYFSDIIIQFKSDSSDLQLVSLELGTFGKWTIIEDWIVLGEVSIGLKRDYSTTTPANTGKIAGSVVIFNNPVILIANKEKIADPWKLSIKAGQTIHLPGLGDLAKWMLPQSALNYIPTALIPFSKGFDLTVLDLDLNATDNKLNQIKFSIKNAEPWVIIDKYLTVTDSSVTGIITTPGKTTSSLAISIEAVLKIGDSGIKFTATKTKPTDNSDAQSFWILSGSLLNSVELSFPNLIQALNLSTKFTVPDWLPTFTLNIFIAKAKTGITEDTKYKFQQFYFEGSIVSNWNVPFIKVRFPLATIGGKLEMDTKAEKYKASIYGALDFNTLKAVLSLQLGTTGIDTIFTATITDEAKNINLSQLSNSLIASSADTETTKLNQTVNWAVLTPSDDINSKLKFDSAFVLFNKTQNKFFLYGSVTNLGSAILLAQQSNQPAQGAAVEQGYLFAVALADNFRFSNLFSSLNIIDNILKIKKGSLVVNSYSKTNAKDIQTEIDAITTNPFAPASITSPFQITNFPSEQVEKGLHIFAALDFTSPLLANIISWRKAGDTADVTLYGFFPQDNKDASGTVFSAEFANFDIFDTISFKGASQAVNGISAHTGPFLQYIAKTGTTDTSSQFTFIGQLGFTAFSNTLSFDAAMVVNKNYAQLTLQPPLSNGQNIVPFPNVLTQVLTIKNLGINFKYTFAQTGPPAVEKFVELDLYGSVSILETIDFTGHLHFLTKKDTPTTSSLAPVLVNVALTSELSISKVFDKLVSKTGSTVTWPANFFDIAFLPEQKDTDTNITRKSELYYYKRANDSASKFTGYTDGYNLESTIALTFINNTINFNLKVNIQPGVGIKANLGITSPINLYILELAGTTQSIVGAKLYLAGPELVLDTTNQQSPRFGFATGFNFLKKPFGTATVLIGKDSKKDLKVSGILTTAADYSPFNLKNKPLTFSYSKNDGFRVDGWPNFIAVFQDIMNILDSIKQLTDTAGRGGPCAAIADFVTDVAIKTKFGLTNPHFETQNGQLYFVLNGTYTVLLLSEVEVCTVTLPSAINVPIPNDLSMDNLLSKIAETIGASALNFVKALMDNPDALAKFIGIVAAKNAAKIGAQMLCRGLIDAAEKAAMEAAAAAVTEAAASAGATVVAALGGAAAGTIVGGALSAISSSHSTNGTGSSSSSGQSNGQPDNNPVSPSLNSLIYTNGKVRAAWSAVMYAVSYELQLTKPSGGDVFSGDVGSDTSKQWDWSETAVGDYKAKVRSVRGSFKSAWSNELKVTKLAAPTNPKIEFNAVINKLSVTWLGNANNYGVQIYKDNNPYQQEQTVSALIYNLDIDTLPAGSYKAVIYAKGSGSLIPSEPVTTTSVIKTAKPTGISVLLNKTQGKINVIWINAANNNGYKVRVLNSAGQEIPVTIPPIQKDAITAAISISDIPTTALAPIKVQVQTLSPDKLDSSFGDGTPVIDRITAPVDVRVSLNKTTGKIAASWTDVVGNNGYAVNLVSANGQKIPITEMFVTENTVNVSLNINDIPSTATAPLKVQVQTLATDKLDSIITEGVASIDKIATPTGITVALNKARGKINIDWVNVPNNNGYKIQILNNAGAVLALTIPTVAKDVATTAINLTTIPPISAAPLKIQVQALSADKLDSNFGDGVPVIDRIAAPAAVTVGLNKTTGKITASWAAIAGSSAYSVNLFSVNYIPFSEIAVSGNMVNATLNISDIPSTAIAPFRVFVQTLATDKLDSINTEGVPTIDKIAAPNAPIVTLDKVQGKINVNWVNVPNNNGYKVRVLNNAGQEIPVTIPPIQKDAITAAININDIPTTALAPIKVQVQTLSADKLDSNFVDGVSLIDRAAAPSAVNVNLNKATGKISASWSIITGNNTYNVNLISANGQTIPANGNALDLNNNITYFFEINAIPNTATAPFKVQVQTVANDKLDSIITEGVPTINRIAAPTNISIVLNRELNAININWATVVGNDGYNIRLVDKNGQAVAGATAFGGKDATVAYFNLDTIPLSALAPFKIQIQTKSANSLDSDYSEGATPINRIAAPTNVSVALDRTTGVINVGWTAVTGNEGYNILLLDKNGQTMPVAMRNIAKNATSAAIDLNDIPLNAPAPFKVWIQAKSNNSLDSDYTEGVTTINRIAAPTNVTVAIDKTAFKINIGWTNVADTEGYNIRLIDANQAVVAGVSAIVDKNATSATLDINAIALITHAPFKVQIQTKSNNSLDSDYTEGTPIINRIAAPTDFTITLNKLSNKININWQNVMGNNGYKIQGIITTEQNANGIDKLIDKDNNSFGVDFVDGNSPATISLRIQTLSATMLDSNFVEQSAAIIAAPSGVVVALDKRVGKINITWTNVADNEGYNIRMLDVFGSVVAGVSTNAVKNATAASIDTTAIPLATHAPFKIQVQTKSLNKLNSVYTDGIPTLDRIATPNNVSINFDKVNNKINLNWTNVPDNNGYFIIQDITVVRGLGAVNTPVGKDITSQSIDFTPADNLTSLRVRLQALSANKLDSNYVEQTFTKIAAPINIAVALDTAKGKINVNWANVVTNNGYNIRLIDKNGQIMSSTSTFKDIITASLDVPMAPNTGVLPYKVQIQTKSADGLDSNFADGSPVLTNVPFILHITDSYYWLPELRQLPCEISFDFICNNNKDELMPLFTKTKAINGQPNVDAITWYLSPHRDDFTFRLQLFGASLALTRHIPGIKPTVGVKYKMRCVLDATTATYYVNDQKYVTANYNLGTIPTEGYFGFAVYAKEDIIISNLVVTKVPVSMQFTVQANQKWQSTGFVLTANRPSAIQYQSGMWSASPFIGMTNANGSPNFTGKEGYTMKGAPEGALIGRVNNNGVLGAPFLIGNSLNLLANVEGILELCINDDLDGRYGAGFADNSGAIVVSITK